MKREIAGGAQTRLNRTDWRFTHMNHWSGPADTFDHTTFCLEETRSKAIPEPVIVVIIDLAADEFQVYATKAGPRYDGYKLKAPPKPAHKPLVTKARAGMGGTALGNDILKELDFLLGVFKTSGLEGLG